METRRGVASGHVRMVDSQQKVEGQFLLFDLDTLDAVIFKGSIDMDPAGSSYGKPSQGPQKKASTDPESQHLDLKSA